MSPSPTPRLGRPGPACPDCGRPKDRRAQRCKACANAAHGFDSVRGRQARQAWAARDRALREAAAASHRSAG